MIWRVIWTDTEVAEAGPTKWRRVEHHQDFELQEEADEFRDELREEHKGKIAIVRVDDEEEQRQRAVEVDQYLRRLDLDL